MTTHPQDTMMSADDRLLPWKKVKDLTGLSRTTAWRLQKAGDFPPPVVISPGRVGWRESEVAVWKASRAPRSASRPAPAVAPPKPMSERQQMEPETVSSPVSPTAKPLKRPPRHRPKKPQPSSQLSLEF